MQYALLNEAGEVNNVITTDHPLDDELRKQHAEYRVVPLADVPDAPRAVIEP
jgi:hypothetical protein